MTDSPLPSKEMAAFEAWAKASFPSMWPNPHEDGTYQWGGHYHNAAVNLMWQGWQAARSAHEPCPECAHKDAYYAQFDLTPKGTGSPPGVCEYALAEGSATQFLTACGGEFWLADGKDLYDFCCLCGKPVEEAPTPTKISEQP